jgi:spheroidene monooxygenase
MLWRRSLEAASAAPVTGAAGEAALAPVAPLPGVVLLMLVRYRSVSVPWGLSRLVLGERALGAVPGLRFARVLGSGRDGGFGLAPSFERQGLIAFFDDEARAHVFAQASPAMHAYRERAQEMLTVLLRATSSRGSWSGQALAATASARADAPVAALTRAAIRPRHAWRFWRHSPGAESAVARAPGCRLAVGLGEAPLLRQATFSLWDNQAAMDVYARGGAHAGAIAGAWREGWFSEWMFVRFAPISIEGQWHGKRHAL